MIKSGELHALSREEELRNAYIILVRDLKETDHLGDLKVNERIKLICLLNR
jgi:hypothetical protein